MEILGFILLVIGAILFYGSKIIYGKSQKKVLDYKQGDTKDNKEFLALVNNGTVVIKTIGALLIIVGGIFIIFLS